MPGGGPSHGVADEIAIDERFQGPPGSANGGYAAGRLAGFVEGAAVEVSLRAPVPLGRPLAVRRHTGGAALLDGDSLIVEARRAELAADAPAPVALADAEEASKRFPYLEGHAFPRCFGCGPERSPGDGLRIFAGPVAGRDDVFAGPWTPHVSLAGDDGLVRPEFVWAALDCSGGCRVANPRSTPPVVLGRIAARIERHVPAGEPHVVVAWPGEYDGRKREAGTAVFDADGRLAAVARALWIELRG